MIFEIRKVQNEEKWKRNKKVMRFEIKRGQNDFVFEKCILEVDKTYFLYYYFLAGFLALHFKDEL